MGGVEIVYYRRLEDGRFCPGIIDTFKHLLRCIRPVDVEVASNLRYVCLCVDSGDSDFRLECEVDGRGLVPGRCVGSFGA